MTSQTEVSTPEATPETEATPEETAPDAEPDGTAPSDDPVGPGTEGPSARTIAPSSANEVAAVTPTNSTTIIRITKRDVRTGSGATAVAHSYAEGARFQLHSENDGEPGAPLTAAWAQCTIGAGDNGYCYFSVPDTNSGGSNRNKQFWVEELEPVPGTPAAEHYDVIDTLRTGGSGAGVERVYAYRTPELKSNTTVDLPEDQDASSSAYQTSGQWANKLKNPTLQPQCNAGIRVALLLDLSGSVKNAGAAGTLGDAAKGFVDALRGTNSSVALYSFGDLSPRAGTSNFPNALPIDSNLNTLNSRIDGYIASFNTPNYESNGTNWDRGLWEVSGNADSYDLAVVLTDGNPTFSGTGPTGPGSNTYFRELEQAIFSANAIKDKGKRVITVGIGDDLSDSNLSSISGPTGYVEGASLNQSDYFKTGWQDLKPLLSDFAKSITCEVPVTVHKLEKRLDGSTANGANWQFTPTLNGAGDLTPNGAQATGTDGSLEWKLKFGAKDDTANLTIAESPQAGWQFASVACANNGDALPVANASSFTLTGVKVGDSIDCTVTNTQLGASVVVNKVWNVNGVDQPQNTNPFGLTAQLKLTGPGSAGASNQDWGVARDKYSIGGGVTMSESYTGVPAGCTTPTASFSKVDGGSSLNGATATGLTAGTNTFRIVNTITCPTTLELKKEVEGGAGDANVSLWTLDATGPSGSKDFAPGTSGVKHDVTPAVAYSLSESATDAATKLYTLKQWECVTDGTTVVTSNPSVPLGKATVCTAINQTAKLTLIKKVDNANGGTATPGQWQLTADPKKAGLTAGTVDGAFPNGHSISILPGQKYELSEAGGPSGYEQTSLECKVGVNGSYAPATSVTANALDDVYCLFVNTEKPTTLKLVKKVSGADTPATNWILSGTGGTQSIGGAGGTNGFVTVKAGVDFTLSEQPVAGFSGAGEFGHSAWVCDNGYGTLTGGKLPGLAVGQNVTCEITNTLNPVVPTITKTAHDPVANADGSWTIVYDIAVTNPSSVKATDYALSDTLKFGGDIVVNSADVLKPGSTTPVAIAATGANELAAAGTALAPSTTAIYVVTVNATVEPGAFTKTPSTLECLPGSTPAAGGFLNTAVLTHNGTTTPAEDCVEPVVPSFSKTAGDVVDNGDGTWNVNYTLTVTNPSGTTGVVYDLSDTPHALPAGTTLTNATVAPIDSAPAPNAVPAFGPGSPAINTAVVLPASTTHSYTVTLTVAVSSSADPATLVCAPGTSNGIVNDGTVLSGNQTLDDGDCATIPLPKITHTKTLDGPAHQNEDGSWTIGYLVTVTNSGATTGVYDLSDTPAFGAGITALPSSTAVLAPDQPIDWNGVDKTALADERPLAAGATDTYRITANAQIAAGVIGTAAADCSLDAPETGTGFRNVATLTTGGATTEKNACDTPTLPVPEKNTPTVTQQPDGSWNVSYVVDVDNSNGKAAWYSLTDTPNWDGQITIDDWTVTAGAGTPAVTVGSWSDANGVIIPADTPIQIEAGATHSYVVSFTVEVPAGLPTSVTTCDDEAHGKGFINTITLKSGADEPSDTACGDVTDAGTPTVDKTVTSTTQNADGSWTIAYDVTVTGNESYVTKYSLSDTLAYGQGISIVGTPTIVAGAGTPAPAADWNGTSKTQVVSEQTIAAQAVHVYTVTVNASVAAGVTGTPAADCELQDGETGTGFLNTAVLTSGGTEQPAEDCSHPAKPSFTKTIAAGQPVASGNDWSVSYTLTATNTDTEQSLVYDLSDVPAFAPGATVLSRTVTSADATVNTAWNTTNGAAPTTDVVASGVQLPAQAVDVFTVTVVFSIADDADAADLRCATTGDGSGKGLFNGATLSSGDDEFTDDACADIPVKVVVTKSWTIDGTGYANGDQPDGFSAALLLTQQNAPAFGTVYGGYQAGATVNVSETAEVPEGCTLESNGGGTKTLDKELNSYELENVVDCEQNLTLVKKVTPTHGGQALPTQWKLSATGAGRTDSFSGDGQASGTVGQGVDYALAEQGGPAGWTVLTDWTCAAEQGDFTLTGSTVSLGYGADVTCTIENTDVAPKLTLVKEVQPADLDIAPQNWTLSADGPTAVSGVTGDATITDAAVDSGEYTLAEAPVADFPYSDEFTASAWECTDVDGAVLVENATLHLGPGDDVTCVITNTAKAAVPAIEKTVSSTTQNADGTWSVVYDITVTNQSNVVPLAYDLDDSPVTTFGTGITINSLSATGPGNGVATWTGAGDHTALATGQALAAGGVDDYTVTVTATVAASAFDNGTAECLPGDNGVTAGGFRNAATVTLADGSNGQTATDCSEPARTTVEKTNVGTPQLVDGKWVVNYAITVTNASAQDLYYDLSDTPALPAGATVTAYAATGPDGPIPGWAGGVLADDVVIAHAGEAPTVHDYTVTLTVDVAALADVTTAQCETGTPGHGFDNEATMTNGTVEYSDDACQDIPVGRLTIVKNVDNSQFDGLDLGDNVLGQPSDWMLTATGGPVIVAGLGKTDGQGITRIVPTGDYALNEATASDNPLLGFYTASAWSCDDQDATVATVPLGGDVTCTITNTGHPVDLAITKTSGGETAEGAAVPTDENDRYQYTFTIQNLGEVAAPNTVVSDEIPVTIAVDPTTYAVPDGWTVTLDGADANGFGGVLTLSKTEPFEAGGQAEFTFWVTTAATLPRENGDPEGKILDILNTAVVTSDGVEKDPSNNESTSVTPVKSIAVSAQGVCLANTPYLQYTVTPYNTQNIDPLDIDLIWWTQNGYELRDPSIPASDVAAILANGAKVVNPIAIPEGWQDGDPITGEQLWPGAVVDDQGVTVGWPGWRQLPNGRWVLDPADPNYDLRSSAVTEVRLNPTTAGTVVYPPADPNCDPNPVNAATPAGGLPSTGFTGSWMGPLGFALLGLGVLLTVVVLIRRRRNREV
ncbi:prealbumin-like fold domain-containing protein [Compostimonas suwonensis]|uniref:prealbumin-like fold domain-containing protein n=1 Tax=Compostimonas suwonensis TaxID=1048394 RepID=UPI0012FD0286|nr:VWA domain-containing protein [Compostimonas suwonensis]